MAMSASYRLESEDLTSDGYQVRRAYQLTRRTKYKAERLSSDPGAGFDIYEMVTGVSISRSSVDALLCRPAVHTVVPVLVLVQPSSKKSKGRVDTLLLFQSLVTRSIATNSFQ